MLSATALDKSFPGVHALRRVDFDVRSGEVHALMGENGAGKSTLIKILTGALQPDSGTINFLGKPIRPASPAGARRLGIAAVYQEVNLIPQLSVAENLFLGRFPRRGLWIDRRRMRTRAREALAALGLPIDPSSTLSTHPIAIRQLVAIARAIDLSARLLILDEPTSSLDRAETDRLFDTVRGLRSRGLGIVFITHFLDQVYRIADRITVLRNGAKVGTFNTADLPRVELVAHMIGRELNAADAENAEDAEKREGARAEQTLGPFSATSAPLRPLRVPLLSTPILSACHLGRRNAIEPFDLDLHPGEVVGLAGLLGSGRTEAARLLFAADRPGPSATLKIAGRSVHPRSPRDSIALSIALTPEDRKESGLFPDMSVRDNICLVVQRFLGGSGLQPGPAHGARAVAKRVLSALGLVNRRKHTLLAERFIRQLGISTPSLDQPVRLLSGGNQQKVILARWLACRPRILLLDEPTRGIDIGAKAQTEALIDELAGAGMAVLFISSELEEVVRRSHRILILRDRRVVGELTREDDRRIPEASVMRAIAG
jgi:galactofuranose transport system ATP-binding protein